jgi:hypothetical protein
VVLSFKRFNGAKTGIGVMTWLYDEHLEKGLKPSYAVYHATDGASNAVASANHYRLLVEMNGVYKSRILHNTCLAHQNNRSAKFASGTGDFKMCSSPVLQDILNKVHQIIAQVHRTHHRINAICQVQKTANCSSIVMPVPSVVTRWDSSSMEVTSLNRIMGDFNKGLNILLDTTDSKLLEERDGVICPCSDFAFTPTSNRQDYFVAIRMWISTLFVALEVFPIAQAHHPRDIVHDSCEVDTDARDLFLDVRGHMAFT